MPFLLRCVFILLCEILAARRALPITSATSFSTRPDGRFTVVKQESRQRYRIAQTSTRALLPELFAEPPAGSLGTPGQLASRAALATIALAAGAAAMLLRI